MLKVLVTGANGFVGHAVWQRLNIMSSVQPLAAVRCIDAFVEPGSSVVTIGELSAQTDWSHALTGVDVVVHSAARVHLLQDVAADPLPEYRRVNVQATLNLARQAAAAGLKRLVFLSSIKVNGEATFAHLSSEIRADVKGPFTADDPPAPQDAYGISKMEAEVGLRTIAAQTGLEVVIIRPPLVYGPGVKANFESMMRLLARGVPLPLASLTENRRSLVALENLVDLIVTCLNHPAAANQTFLVGDGEDLSTADLLRRMGAAMGQPARLFYLPLTLLKLGASVLNRPAVYHSLCGSLQLDIAKTRQLLGWTPRVSVDEGLRRAAAGFRL